MQEGFIGSPLGFKGGLWGISVTTGWIVLKFGDMIDMDMKLCKRVSTGPPWGSKGVHGASQLSLDRLFLNLEI